MEGDGQSRQAEVHTLTATLAMLREDFHHNLALLDDRDAELARCGARARRRGSGGAAHWVGRSGGGS
jgi:hypothetical protein